MNSKAQAGLEYLMTYGWALIIIATVVGVLVFVVSTPADDVIFSSSDPTKIMFKASAVIRTNLELKLQNITGGNIVVTEVTLPAGYGGCEINGNSFPAGATTTTSIDVGGGGEIFIKCTNMSETIGQIDFDYRDSSGLLQKVFVKASGGSCIEDATRACANQTGVCFGFQETCSGGSWPGCGATEYGGNYEATELTCNDGLDNDCDGSTDCADPDCDLSSPCGSGM